MKRVYTKSIYNSVYLKIVIRLNRILITIKTKNQVGRKCLTRQEEVLHTVERKTSMFHKSI
jgi:hypothetical protein